MSGNKESDGVYHCLIHGVTTTLRSEMKTHIKQSSARQPERGTTLTVEKQYGEMTVYEQQEIREIPEYPFVTKEARKAKEATA